MTSLVPEEDASQLTSFLAESGLVEADVPGWRYVDPFSLNILLGFDPSKRVQSDGIAIPYLGLDGVQETDQGLPFHRVRLLQVRPRPDGKPAAKYLSPNGAVTHVYIPGRTRLSIQAGTLDTLVITEGEKKAELLAKFGVDAVALPGISMGQVRRNPDQKDEPRVLVDSLVALVEAGIQKGLRCVVVLFDAEGHPKKLEADEKTPNGFVDLDKKRRLVVRNASVYFEAMMLARSLREQFIGLACTAMWAEIPEGWPLRQGQDPDKAGVDDWALSVGEGAVRQAIAEVSAHAKRVTAEEKGERDRRKAALEEEGYHPLGMESGKGGEPIAVLWSKRNGKMVRLSPADMSKQATWLGVFGPTFACDHWPKFNKEGQMTAIDLLAAQKEVFAACQSKHEWSSSRERGGGVWSEGDVLFINAKEGLFYCAQDDGFVALGEEDRHTGRNIYPRAGDFSIGMTSDQITADFLEGIRDSERQKSDIDTLIRHFQQWGGMTEFESAPAMLLAGWIAASSVLGAMTARPSMIISGESGAGKSVLAEHISQVLGKTALRIDDGASATEPGIRQKLGKDARALLLDEAEPGSSNASVSLQRAGNLRRIMNLLRAAYSTTDSDNTDSVASLKGSLDGRAVDYSLRTSAILFAIGKPDLEQADRNRTILVELRKDSRAPSTPSNQGLHDLGVRIRFAMWSHWNDFRALLTHIHALCADPDQGLQIEARVANTWGVPIAALLCFAELAVRRAVNPASMSDRERQGVDHEIRAILSNVQKMQRALSPSDEQGSDAEQALNLLMRARIRAQVQLDEEGPAVRYQNMELSVSECLFKVYQDYVQYNAQKSSMRDWQVSLKRYGLAYGVGYDKLRRADDPQTPISEKGYPRHMVFVSDSSELRKILAGTAYATQNIENILLRLPGAQRSQVRVAGGLRMSGVRVPFEMYDPEDHAVEPPMG